MIEQIKNTINSAFTKLLNQDGSLFECPEEQHADYDSRKLHEVCINHHLALYLKEYIFPIIEQNGEKYFTDIEFNREGIDFKNIMINGQEKRVRPDIIIHNRKSGDAKNNFLIVECKKETSPDKDKRTDIEKIKSFLTDQNYLYSFGLQVIYDKNRISGTLYYVRDGNIIECIIRT